MIAYLRGIVIDADGGSVVIDVNGVGYEVYVTPPLAQKLLDIDGEAELYIHTHFSESGAALYGFLHKEELTVFKHLVTVSGIGPKGAMAILSTFSAGELIARVIAEDAKAISRAPGVGTKTAQKLVIELKDKFRVLAALSKNEPDAYDDEDDSDNDPAVQVKNEALEALMALGYSRAEASKAISGSGAGSDVTVEELIRLSLRSRRV